MAVDKVGFPVAACCGGNLTKFHLNTLKKHYNKITLCFDNDQAGKKSEEKALGLLLKNNFIVDIIQLTDKDPDELIQSENEEKLYHQLQSPKDPIKIKILKISNTIYRNISDRIKDIDELLMILKLNFRELIIRQYVKFAAKVLNENESVLLDELNLHMKKNIIKQSIIKNILNEKEILLLQSILAQPSEIKNLPLEIINTLNIELKNFLLNLLNQITSNPKENEIKILKELNIEFSTEFLNHIKESRMHQELISKKIAAKIISDFVSKNKETKRNIKLTENYKNLLKAEKFGNLDKIKLILLNQSCKIKKNKSFL